jgi:hypothetical protein
MAVGPCCNKSHNPVILSGAKACPEPVEGDPLHACTNSGSARNFYDGAEFPATH